MKLITEITDKEILGTDELSSAEPRYTARAILKNGNLYAVMYAKKFNLYSLPGGGIDDGEDIITALKREILEETGCTCGNIAELGIVKENRASADYTQCSYYFVVEADSVGMPQLTDAEKNNKTELQWHTLTDTIKLINDFQPKTYQQQYLKARDVAALNEYIKSMTIYLVRHGADDDSVRGGWSNHPLTDEGLKQSEELAKKLKENNCDAEIIYSSDLFRARQTAEILAKSINLEVEYNTEFREVNNGDLAGLNNDLANELYPNLYWRKLEWEQHYPNNCYLFSSLIMLK